MSEMDARALSHNLPYKIVDRGGYLDPFYVRHLASIGAYMRSYPTVRFDVIDLRRVA